MPYKSIFETKTFITKADLCEILNLDPNRANLNFSASEIKKAYRKRTLRIHPDRQGQYDTPIPAEDCTILMSDAVLARDYLLNNEDNIPGSAFQENLHTNTLDDWFDICINTIKNIKSVTTSTFSSLNYFSYISNNFLVLFTLANYSDNKLNFRFINEYSDILNNIRPYIEKINGTALSEALKQIQLALTSIDDNELTLALDKLDEALPANITSNDKYNELKDAIKEARKDISEVLTDKVIANIKHVFDFWPNLIATMPSWRHIIGVYIHTMLFTAITFPKHINAVSEILKVILKQKGKLAFSLVVIPFILLNIAILPLKLLSQISLQALPISAKVLYRLISNGMQLIRSVIHLIKMIFSTTDYAFNKIIDDLIAMIKPESIKSNSDTIFNQSKQTETENEQPLVELYDENQSPQPQPQPSAPNPPAFFESKTFIANEDPWLEKILSDVLAPSASTSLPAMVDTQPL